MERDTSIATNNGTFHLKRKIRKIQQKKNNQKNRGYILSITGLYGLRVH